jgi:hypothetical protein
MMLLAGFLPVLMSFRHDIVCYTGVAAVMLLHRLIF